MTILTVEKIIAAGLGLGRLEDGLVVMVPYVLPGEKVKLAVDKPKKGYAKATLLEVLVPSPSRVEPPCPYYGECGGCNFQHITYKKQLQVKKELLVEQLQRLGGGGKDANEFELAGIDGADDPLHYRQRIRLQVDRGRMGFFRSATNNIVEVSTCLLAAPLINSVLAALRESQDMALLLKNSDSVELKLSTDEQKIIVLLSFLRKVRPQDKMAAKDLVNKVGAIKSLVIQTKQWGNVGPFVSEQLAENVEPERISFGMAIGSSSLRFSLEAGGFCQVNHQQNLKLVRTMLDWGMVGTDEKVLDLFCGMGNFSIPAARYARKVIGCDLQRSAIRSAKRNAVQNGLTNCSFEQKSAVQMAAELAAAADSFDLVILDPPRQGCKQIIPYMNKIVRGKIIYISCDPATLSRDIAELGSCGYNIVKIKGVDMFPQTHHLESIVLLQSSS